MAAVGMVVAIEVDAVLDRYGKAVHEEKLAGVNFMEYRTEYGTLYVAHSGPGEIAAAAATALLIGHYGAELIINFGVVGGLTLRHAHVTHHGVLLVRLVVVGQRESHFGGALLQHLHRGVHRLGRTLVHRYIGYAQPALVGQMLLEVEQEGFPYLRE